MKVEQLNYYPLFIFKAENFCFQTADSKLLKYVFDSNMEVKSSFKVKDEVIFKMQEGNYRKFEVTNIEINNVVDDTELNQMGVVSYGCSETVGKLKDELMFLFIEMTEVEMK
jgi:hypothetical protein